MSMKLLLLGSQGQLGSDLQGVQAEQYSEKISLQAATRQDLDVSQTADIFPYLMSQDFEVLVNCTSYHRTDEVEGHANLAMQVNAHAVREMAKACQAKGAKFLHISTDYVFGGSDLRRPLRETDAPAPLNVYGASKLLGENLARHFCQNTYIFRVASLFGKAGASGKGGNFVNTMLRLSSEKSEISVVSDQIMSPTSTADLAEMLFKLLLKDAPFGIYHAVNSGAPVSWYELTRAIFEFSGIKTKLHPIPASQYPTQAQRPPYSALDNAKLKSIIGEIPAWQDGLKRYLFLRKTEGMEIFSAVET